MWVLEAAIQCLKSPLRQELSRVLLTFIPKELFSCMGRIFAYYEICFSNGFVTSSISLSQSKDILSRGSDVMYRGEKEWRRWRIYGRKQVPAPALRIILLKELITLPAHPFFSIISSHSPHHTLHTSRTSNVSRILLHCQNLTKLMRPRCERWQIGYIQSRLLASQFAIRGDVGSPCWMVRTKAMTNHCIHRQHHARDFQYRLRRAWIMISPCSPAIVREQIRRPRRPPSPPRLPGFLPLMTWSRSPSPDTIVQKDSLESPQCRPDQIILRMVPILSAPDAVCPCPHGVQSAAMSARFAERRSPLRVMLPDITESTLAKRTSNVPSPAVRKDSRARIIACNTFGVQPRW